jgi:hypothetical protein
MLGLSAPNKGHKVKDIKAAMEQALNIEDDFSRDTVHEFPVKAGKGYYIDRGTVEFSRGTTIEAYVYIIMDDGEIIAERLDMPGELELWTKHLG